ncbi:hypothetical protein H4R99_004779, partial [Coemansia sp. RSA 1722]
DDRPQIFQSASLTSTLCPYCKTGRLKKSFPVENPRPLCQDKWPIITSRALLRCNSVTCIGRMAGGDSTDLLSVRHTNRDLAAVLNFQHIVRGLRLNSKVPERCQRPKRARNTVTALIDGNAALNEPTTQRQ